jgi:hypothetical protein
MWKAFMAAMKYRSLLPIAIDFVEFVQEATADGKLSSGERSKILSYMWRIVKEAEKVNASVKKAA